MDRHSCVKNHTYDDKYARTSLTELTLVNRDHQRLQRCSSFDPMIIISSKLAMTWSPITWCIKTLSSHFGTTEYQLEKSNRNWWLKLLILTSISLQNTSNLQFSFCSYHPSHKILICLLPPQNCCLITWDSIHWFPTCTTIIQHIHKSHTLQEAWPQTLHNLACHHHEDNHVYTFPIIYTSMSPKNINLSSASSLRSILNWAARQHLLQSGSWADQQLTVSKMVRLLNGTRKFASWSGIAPPQKGKNSRFKQPS